jgi:hypothetical protein
MKFIKGFFKFLMPFIFFGLFIFSLLPAFPGLTYFMVDDHRSEAFMAFFKAIPEKNYGIVAFSFLFASMTAGCFYMWQVLMGSAQKPSHVVINEKELDLLAHNMAREAFGDLAQFKEYEVNELMLTYRDMLRQKFLTKKQ